MYQVRKELYDFKGLYKKMQTEKGKTDDRGIRMGCPVRLFLFTFYNP